MKLTKRMQNAIIQASIINIVILLIFVGIILIFIYPKIQNIVLLKNEFSAAHNEYTPLLTTGLSFTQLNDTIQQEGLSNDLYTATLLSSIEENFYNSIFTNTGSEDFSSFIKKIEDNISEVKTSEKYIQKDNSLNSILPVYTKDANIEQEGLTDFYFINYIENLLYTFNLKSKGEIGIGEIEKTAEDEGEQVENTQKNDLQEEIFKIPMEFEVEGTKSDIVDFIHFFEYVGKININEDEFSIYTDKFITKSLDGEKFTSSYNIYQNQIADISIISLSDYPDSSAIPTSSPLISSMKTTQARDQYSAKLEINFYISGIANYKMKKYIETVNLDYQKLKALITSDAQKYSLVSPSIKTGSQIQALQKIQSLDSLLTEMLTDIKDLQTKSVSQSTIQDGYELAIVLRQKLDTISEVHAQEISKLTQN